MMRVGILGAGVMGIGVAQNFARYGYEVILVDINQEVLKKAEDEIYNTIRIQSLFHKDNALLSAKEAVKKIQFTMDYEALNHADFIIENVPEIWEIKEEVYKKIDNICPKHCIFMVNTSCISITKIGSLVNRKEQVVGTHFMNPVPMKSVIEMIQGYHTSVETIEKTKKLLEGVKKRSIVVKDYPGFVSNRLSHLLMNEAAFVVQDQVAVPEEVDDLFRECFGHKMGPLETADLIGLDTVVNSLDILYESYQDSKFRCCPLLRKMVDAGLHGKKSGKGFYDYM